MRDTINWFEPPYFRLHNASISRNVFRSKQLEAFSWIQVLWRADSFWPVEGRIDKSFGWTFIIFSVLPFSEIWGKFLIMLVSMAFLSEQNCLLPLPIESAICFTGCLNLDLISTMNALLLFRHGISVDRISLVNELEILKFFPFIY